jgi:Threonyl-tRNA synthetase
MSQIELTFPDGSVRSVASGTTGLEIAKGISEGLARKALGVKLGDKVLDLTRPLTESGTIKIITPSNDDPDALMPPASLVRTPRARRSYLRPVPGHQARLRSGYRKGFLLRFDDTDPIQQSDFERIEKRMKEIIKEDRPFTRCEVSAADGLKRTEGDKYKTDNAQRALAREGSDGTLSFYVTGEPGKTLKTSVPAPTCRVLASSRISRCSPCRVLTGMATRTVTS